MIFHPEGWSLPFWKCVSPNENTGLTIHLENLREKDPVKALFAENPGVVLQVASSSEAENYLKEKGIAYTAIASIQTSARVEIPAIKKSWDLPTLRDTWYRFFFFAGSATIRKETGWRAI